MLTPERHEMILQFLKESSIVKIQDLVDKTNTSESTIRRDLIQLEEEKKLKRVHGGAARLQGKLEESSMIEKATKNIQEKRQIAKYAASLIEAGDCVYLDAGSTVMEMIEYLPLKDIVIVTNGLMHINRLLEKQVSTYILGGFAKYKTNAVIGRGALESLQHYRFDKCFIGVNGIHSQFGFTTPDQEEAMIKEEAMALSSEVFVVSDHTKFSEVSFAKITDLERATIITNELDDEMKKKYASKTTIKVVTT